MFFHNSYIICSLCGMNPLFFRIQRNHNLLNFWKCFGVSQQRRCQKFEILKVTKIELEYSDQESHWIIHKIFDIYANFMKLSLCSSTPIKISHRTLSSLFSSEWFSKVPAFLWSISFPFLDMRISIHDLHVQLQHACLTSWFMFFSTHMEPGIFACWNWYLLFSKNCTLLIIYCTFI